MPVGKVVFDNDQIKGAISNLAFRLNQDYEHALIVGVLDGCLPFFDYLLARLNFPFTTRFVKYKRYEGDKPTTNEVFVREIMSLKEAQGQCVLIVDDIIDKGVTYNAVEDYLKRFHPDSVNGCFLVGKGEQKDFYTGLTLHDDTFVVGFGMDFNGQCRDLPYIAEWNETRIV